MISKNLFLVLVVILVLTIGGVMGQDKKYTEVAGNQDLKDFIDKTIKISGKKPKFVDQHPILTSPFGDKKEVQSYMDTAHGQIVLISEKEIECSDQITVLGTLKHISLGGSKNTKNSYENFLIKVDSFECKDN